MLELAPFAIFVGDLKWKVTGILAKFADYTKLHVVSKRKLSAVAERAPHYTQQNSSGLLLPAQLSRQLSCAQRKELSGIL